MDKTKIDWADSTLNPLGFWCYGPGGDAQNPKPCAYCYAKRMSRRNVSDCELCRKFEKHEHLDRLGQLRRWKQPRNVFIQSMGDLFHDEVPDEWIAAVFKACEAAPWHRYLFLTKNPARYLKLYVQHALPHASNYWFGSTITRPSDNYAYMHSLPFHSFVSAEPLLAGGWTGYEPSDLPEWVIIGAETGNRKGKVVPKREWIENIASACRITGVPVFMKESLRELMGEDFVQEFPWEA